MSDVRKAQNIVKTKVRSEFERIWKEVTEEEAPEYRILIWGSTIQDKEREPVDLDLIFEYETSSISPDKEKSIEGWLKNSITCEHFNYIDPLVIHYLETPDIISNSRVSRVYSVDEDGWLEF